MEEVIESELSYILDLIKKYNIQVTLRNNRLFLFGSPNEYDSDVIDVIRANKSKIEEWLRQSEEKYDCDKIYNNSTNVGPLSSSQQRLWLVDELEQGSAHYNMVYQFKITGKINIVALQQAVTDLITRHSILRTRIYKSDSGVGQQEVCPPIDNIINIIKFPTVHYEDYVNQLNQISKQEASQSFVLASAIKLRATLIQFEGFVYSLFFTVHHIASDGWSESILFNELSLFYTAQCTDVPPSLDVLPVHYLDYSIWQRNNFTQKKQQKETNYWHSQLESAPSLHSIRTDFPRPEIQTFQGKQYYQSIDKILSDSFKTICKQYHSTLFIGAAALFSAWQYRIGGEADIVFGVPVANRDREEVSGLIGLFINMLPIRMQVSGEQSFLDLLQASREISLDALSHQQLSFEQLVQSIQPARNLSYHPIFQTVLAVQTNEPYTLQLMGTLVEEVQESATKTLFDIQLDIYDRPEGLQFVWQYSTDLFDQTTIAQFADYFTQLLRSAILNPSLPVSQLSMYNVYSVSEQRKVFRHGDLCLHELFEQQALNHPGRKCVVSATGSKTYGDLDIVANQIAHRLHQAGVKPGELVAVVMNKGWEQVAAVLGIHKSGGAYLPLSVSDPSSRIHKLLALGDVKIVLTQQSVKSGMGWPVNIEVWEVDLPVQWQNQPTNCLLRQQENTDLAYVIFTSGTTGEPKGVMISHRAATNTILDVNERFGITSEDTILGLSALHFDLSVYDIFGILGVGGKLVLPDDSDNLSPMRWWQLVCDEGVSLWNTVPAFAQLFIECGLQKMTKSQLCNTRLRQFLMSGDWIPLNLPKKIRLAFGEQIRICSLGGATEASIWSIIYPITDVRPEWSSIPYGKSMFNQSVSVLDEQLCEVPVGVVGELYIGGCGLADGYWKDHSRSALAFIQCPYSGKLLYRTGDLGRYRQSGDIEFLGRKDSQVKIRGFRVELGEIEYRLQQHPSIEYAVVTLCKMNNEQTLVAYCVPPENQKSDQKKNEDIIRSWETIYDNTYTQIAQEESLTQPDFSGWNSSYTNEAIPLNEMKERLQYTLERLIGLNPKHILEIGCGTGLMMYGLLDHCLHYTGFDLSDAVVHRHQQRLEHEGIKHARVFCSAADSFEHHLINDSEHGSFQVDTVIINSVIQYFPSLDYLESILLSVVNYVGQGKLFIGDIRDYRLQREFHTSVELYNHPDAPHDTLQKKVDQRCLSEVELLVAPEFFYMLAKKLPGAFRVDILPERGEAEHEMHLFRYDVVIHIDRERTHDCWQPRTIRWHPDLDLQNVLKNHDAVMIEGYPNMRVWPLCNRGRNMVQHPDDLDTVLSLEVLFEFANNLGFELDVQLSLCGENAKCNFDLCFVKKTLHLPQQRAHDLSVHSFEYVKFSNLIHHADRLDFDIIRDYVEQYLPEYMHPQHYTQLDKLPLNSNGKIDKKALPSPNSHEENRYLAPSTPTEEMLEACWQKILGITTPVSVNANFFEVGGHSLLAARVSLEVENNTGLTITVRQLFTYPTIASLAVLIDDMEAENDFACNVLHSVQDDSGRGKLIF